MATSIPSVVDQILDALALSRSKPLPPPDTLPRDLLASAQILGQDPGLRRPLGSAGQGVFTAWTTGPAAAPRVIVKEGNGQVQSAGTAVRISPAILVTDGFGRPAPNIGVSFRANAPGGATAVILATTGQDGIARTTWILGTEPGLNTLDVFLGSVGSARVANFTAFGLATRRIEIVEGDGLSATKKTAVKPDPKVRVVAADSGTPIAGVNVSFTIGIGGGTAVPTSASTGSDGTASCTWTLGGSAGNNNNTLVADAAGADPVTFTASAS
ncbi:MAG TPA: hypothetical protein VH762_18350 [Gemmatimonadaceae bacterium]|jgi:hypothetical protein